MCVYDSCEDVCVCWDWPHLASRAYWATAWGRGEGVYLGLPTMLGCCEGRTVLSVLIEKSTVFF